LASGAGAGDAGDAGGVGGAGGADGAGAAGAGDAGDAASGAGARWRMTKALRRLAARPFAFLLSAIGPAQPVAHRFEAGGVDPVDLDEVLADGVGPVLRELEVVLLGTVVVGVALDAHLRDLGCSS
jgi:hypothetical protein